MTYPTDIPAFRAALLAYEPGELHADAIYAAQAHASIVPQAVKVFECLKASTATLNQEGLRLLAGAAHLIAANAWQGLGSEALGVFAQVQPLLTPTPAPPP